MSFLGQGALGPKRMATGLRRGRTAAFGADLWIDASGNTTIVGTLALSGAVTSSANSIIAATSGAAGADSYALRLQGVTSAATRNIDVINEADAGTDTYRLRANNTAGTAMATLESDGTLTTTGVHIVPLGSASACAIASTGGVNNGIYFGSTTQVNVSAGGVNVCDFVSTGIVQITSSGSANGDDSNILRFRFKTNGSFRIMDIQAEADSGADTYRLRINDNAGDMMAAVDMRRWLLLDESDSDPTTAELDADDSGAIYFKANKIVFAVNVGGTVRFAWLPIDNATTTWSVAAP